MERIGRGKEERGREGEEGGREGEREEKASVSPSLSLVPPALLPLSAVLQLNSVIWPQVYMVIRPKSVRGDQVRSGGTVWE